jgi:hypothetical protein
MASLYVTPLEPIEKVIFWNNNNKNFDFCFQLLLVMNNNFNVFISFLFYFLYSREFGAIRSTDDRRVTNRISWKSHPNKRLDRHPDPSNNSVDLWQPNFVLFLRLLAMLRSFYWQR